MSSRVELLPEAYCKELEKLRQNVKPLDPEVAKAIIEEETGKTIDEIYSEFRDEPLGSAIACILFIGSCILASVDIQPKIEATNMPLISVVGIVFSIALAIYSVSKLTKKKK